MAGACTVVQSLAAVLGKCQSVVDKPKSAEGAGSALVPGLLKVTWHLLLKPWLLQVPHSSRHPPSPGGPECPAVVGVKAHSWGGPRTAPRSFPTCPWQSPVALSPAEDAASPRGVVFPQVCGPSPRILQIIGSFLIMSLLPGVEVKSCSFTSSPS